MSAFFDSPTGQQPQGVYVLDPATGLPTLTGGGGGGSGSSTPTVTGTVTPTVTIATGAGTVAAGARSIGFAVTGAAAASIAGQNVPSGVAFSFVAPGVSTLDAVAYSATGTTLVITTTRGGTETSSGSSGSSGASAPDGTLVVVS